ncbi:hypothetical protein [Legionella sp. CNM-4043-24]|uniref:hypothetical protein n=1 Tax=Legionella sp. CNM-4043-24 TaxID=3421646 RepID=UPI00403A8A63
MKDASMDAGTKLLYLERALTLDCDSFLKSLDLLYRPEGGPSLVSIGALKQLNDWSLSQDDREAFRQVIQPTVDRLKQGNLFELGELMNARRDVESRLEPCSLWCFDLELPLSQMFHWISYYTEIFDEHPEYLSIVNWHGRRACELIQCSGMTQREMEILATDELKLNLAMQYLPALRAILRTTLFTGESLFQVDCERLSLLLDNPDETSILMNSCYMSSGMLSRLEPSILTGLLDNASFLAPLSQENRGWLPALLVSQSPSIPLVIRHADKYLRLIKGVPILVNSLLATDKTRLECILNDVDNTLYLLIHTSVTLEQLQELPLPVFHAVFERLDNLINHLICGCDIPAETLLNTNVAVLSLLLQQARRVLALVTEDESISADALLELPCEQLSTLLMHPESDEAREIHDTLSNSGALRFN